MIKKQQISEGVVDTASELGRWPCRGKIVSSAANGSRVDGRAGMLMCSQQLSDVCAVGYRRYRFVRTWFERIGMHIG